MAEAHVQTLCDHCINQKCPVLRRIMDNKKMVFKTIECASHIDGMAIPDDIIKAFGDGKSLKAETNLALINKVINIRTAIATFLKDNPEFDWSDFGF
jgi:hypothetical protein